MIVLLLAPSCAGKSFLIDKLRHRHPTSRLVREKILDQQAFAFTGMKHLWTHSTHCRRHVLFHCDWTLLRRNQRVRKFCQKVKQFKQEIRVVILRPGYKRFRKQCQKRNKPVVSFSIFCKLYRGLIRKGKSLSTSGRVSVLSGKQLNVLKEV